jgi:FKBP-type peptidyl-prolyl cis-trans isomerase SlyD
MTIENDKVITINYVLKDDSGTLIDESQDGSFCYLHGASNIIPGMENALTGRSQGDELNLVIEPAEAYGEYNPNLTQVVDRSMFDANDNIEAGMQFQAQDQEGHVMVITVAKVEGEQITIDGNHPLAGATLHYDIKVVDIRDATDEELSHGHVHQQGGCGH